MLDRSDLTPGDQEDPQEPEEPETRPPAGEDLETGSRASGVTATTAEREAVDRSLFQSTPSGLPLSFEHEIEFYSEEGTYETSNEASETSVGEMPILLGGIQLNPPNGDPRVWQHVRTLIRWFGYNHMAARIQRIIRQWQEEERMVQAHLERKEDGF